MADAPAHAHLASGRAVLVTSSVVRGVALTVVTRRHAAVAA